MSKKATGRMINVEISMSTKIADLSPPALALFCLLIPHFNAHGKMLANPHLIKGLVCPLIEWLQIPDIERCLEEISKKTNVKWWKDKSGIHYLQSINWRDHQELRDDRMGADRFPDYPGVIPEYPGVVPPEVEVEVKGEVKDLLSGLEPDCEEDGNDDVGQKDKIPYSEIIGHLNDTCGTRYRNIKTNQDLIRPLWALGFRVPDFVRVINAMNAKWGRDPTMRQYLRPATLFQPKKFEGYLNTAVDVAAQGGITMPRQKKVSL